MPARRSHTKSHSGCLQCKKRRVKCDESHPRCNNCTKRELLCSFQGLDRHPRKATTSDSIDTEPQDKTTLFKGLLGDEPVANRTLELRLIHHFSTVTCTTLAEDREGIQILQETIPKISFSHSFLLDSILAISAIHLAHLEDRSKRKFWFQIALKYQNRTLLGFNTALVKISPSNSEAIILCSVLVLLITISLPGVTDDENYHDPVSEILSLRKLFQGVISILIHSLDTLQSGVLAPYFASTSKSELQKILQDKVLDDTLEQHPQPQEQEEASHSELSPTLQSTISALKKLHAVITNTYPNNDDRQRIYLSAYHSLQTVIEMFPRNGSFWDILDWPLYISTPFLSLLEANDAMALLIFIHYGVAFNLITHRWFVKDTGKRLVRALVPHLHCAAVQAQQDWVQIIEWARNTVRLV